MLRFVITVWYLTAGLAWFQQDMTNIPRTDVTASSPTLLMENKALTQNITQDTTSPTAEAVSTIPPPVVVSSVVATKPNQTTEHRPFGKSSKSNVQTKAAKLFKPKSIKSKSSKLGAPTR